MTGFVRYSDGFKERVVSVLCLERGLAQAGKASLRKRRYIIILTLANVQFPRTFHILAPLILTTQKVRTIIFPILPRAEYRKIK